MHIVRSFIYLLRIVYDLASLLTDELEFRMLFKLIERHSQFVRRYNVTLCHALAML